MAWRFACSSASPVEGIARRHVRGVDSSNWSMLTDRRGASITQSSAVYPGAASGSGGCSTT
eukprot:2108590-Alexandrium_andersonii.AAC.1